MASVIAIVAEEGVLLIEPPVEIEARAKRFREVIEGESRAKLWVLEHERRLVGGRQRLPRGGGEEHSAMRSGAPAHPQMGGLG